MARKVAEEGAAARRRRESKNEMLLSYRPDRKQYRERTQAEVMGRVVQAKALAAVIAGIGDQAEQDQQAKVNTFDHMVKLFEGSLNLGIPEKNRYVSFDARSSKPADVIFRVMGMLTVPPKFQYIAPKGSSKDANAQNSIEAYLNAYPKWLFRRYQKRWDFQSRFWQLLVGHGYLKQSYLPFYWDKNVRKRRTNEEDSPYNARIEGYKGYMGPPFVVEAPDPRTVFPIKNKLGTEGYVFKYRVSRYEFDDAFARVGKRVELSHDGKPLDIQDISKLAGQVLPVQSDQTALSSDVEYWELIDDVMCYYVVGTDVVHKYRHDGGIKVLPSFGLQTGFEEHHLAAMGILWAVRNELVQYDFLRTLWMQKAYLDVFPQLIAELAGDEDPILGDDSKPVQWNIEPGTVKQIRGKLVSAMKDAGSSMDFRAAVEMMAGDIDLATIPGIARGIAGAQQAGFSINQLSQAMRTLWSPIVDSGELQFSGLGEHFLWVNKNLVNEGSAMFAEVANEETGTRTGKFLELDPDDIDEYCMVEAKLEPDLPIDQQGNMRTLWELYMAGGITWEDWVRDGRKKTNPVEERNKVERDQGRRAFLPKALEDAQALGRVKLNNRIIQQRGLDNLNAIGNMDIQALKLARSQQEPPTPGQAAPGGATTASGAAPMPPEAGIGAVPMATGQSGATIAPTVGAAPPPRIQ